MKQLMESTSILQWKRLAMHYMLDCYIFRTVNFWGYNTSDWKTQMQLGIGVLWKYALNKP